MTANRFRFRAWDKDSESMIPDRSSGIHGYSTDETGAIYGVEHHTLSFSSAGIAENIILMQSTGLTDRNGKEIFEGDVVLVNKRIKGCAPVFTKCGYEVYWDAASSKFNLRGRHWGMIYCSYEIIGNIYENPELLEKK